MSLNMWVRVREFVIICLPSIPPPSKEEKRVGPFAVLSQPWAFSFRRRWQPSGIKTTSVTFRPGQRVVGGMMSLTVILNGRRISLSADGISDQPTDSEPPTLLFRWSAATGELVFLKLNEGNNKTTSFELEGGRALEKRWRIGASALAACSAEIEARVRAVIPEFNLAEVIDPEVEAARILGLSELGAFAKECAAIGAAGR